MADFYHPAELAQQGELHPFVYRALISGEDLVKIW